MPTASQKEWQKVFQLAVKKAKECQAKTGKSYKDCVKMAWKDPAVKKAKEDYQKKHKK
jgi:hypothetical protein